MRIFITGATGFVGMQLAIKGMQIKQHEMLLLARDDKKIPEKLENLKWHIGDINSLKTEDLKGVDIIIHCAAKAHDAGSPMSDYIVSNTLATAHLAKCAAEAGVKRFIFISTIKVHGEYTEPGKLFRETDIPAPVNTYSITKFQSEQQLQQIASQTAMDWVIFRPPLMYGAQMKGNLQKLAVLIKRKRPLPFGAIKNNRSILSVDNFVDAVWHVLSMKKASKKIYLICDGKPVSTPELAHYIAKAINSKIFLIPIPQFILKFICLLLRKPDIYTRVCLSLEVDDNKIREELGWSPPFTIQESISKAVL